MIVPAPGSRKAPRQSEGARHCNFSAGVGSNCGAKEGGLAGLHPVQTALGVVAPPPGCAVLGGPVGFSDPVASAPPADAS